MMTILVTGGAGFIGSALVRHLLAATDATVVNVDKLTYAGNLESLPGALGHPRHIFEQVDLCDAPALRCVFTRHQPDAVLHLAAETHVDRSIDGPAAFVRTNVVGTCTLLEEARAHLRDLSPDRRSRFRLLHVSTDEVYGALDDDDRLFTETTPYAPNSPYAASKAAADHLVRAWHRTYGLPVLITNCSNNYGPYQFPEKLIPLMILNALEGKPLPVYGEGTQVRDWLHVEDHVRALLAVLDRGAVGESYNIGGNSQRQNLTIVQTVCDLLESLAPGKPPGVRSYRELITHVPDRPGHDRRYAIDATRIRSRLGWTPRITFEAGLESTIRWYLEHRTWCERVQSGVYRRERLGVVT